MFSVPVAAVHANPTSLERVAKLGYDLAAEGRPAVACSTWSASVRAAFLQGAEAGALNYLVRAELAYRQHRSIEASTRFRPAGEPFDSPEWNTYFADEDCYEAMEGGAE